MDDNIISANEILKQFRDYFCQKEWPSIPDHAMYIKTTNSIYITQRNM